MAVHFITYGDLQKELRFSVMGLASVNITLLLLGFQRMTKKFYCSALPLQILCPNTLNMILEVPHLICQATGSDTYVFMNMFLLFKTIEGILLLTVQLVHIMYP